MKHALFLGTLLVLGSCSPPKEKIPDSMPATDARTSKMIIYQMMTRLFGNVNTTNKPYGTIEENGVGKFNDITETALRELRSLGATHIWYTGVIEHATLTDNSASGIPADDPDVVKGRAGSPYSIKDYYDVDPDLATTITNRMQEFAQLVDRTHNAGLKVIIDFVPNHVARRYNSDAKPAGVKDLGEEDDLTVSFRRDNNFYYLPGQSFQSPPNYNPLGVGSPLPLEDRRFEEVPAKITGNGPLTASPTVNDWFEAVKVNYGVDIFNGQTRNFEPVPNTWNKMLDILLFWCSKKVDGFRCDMAEMVPVEFWNWAVPQVKERYPDVIFIAEIYQPPLYEDYIKKGKFDFLYDKVQLYDTLRLLMSQKSSSTAIPQIQASLSGFNARMVHFMENHDEHRIASRFFAGDPWKAVPAMIVSAMIDAGPVMIYFGQEVGEPAVGVAGFSQDDGTTTKFDYWGVPEHQKWVNGHKYDGGGLDESQRQLRQFYGDILNFAATNPAIVSGDYVDLTAENVSSGNFTGQQVAFARVAGDERLIILANFSPATAHMKVRASDVAAQKMGLVKGNDYLGRDLLRSGTDVGLNEELEFEVDVPAFSGMILKIK
jgi:glycosidase